MTTLFTESEDIDSTIKLFLENNLNRFGKFLYSYLVMNKKDPGKLKIISNYPKKWIEIYTVNKFQYIDPVIIHSLMRLSPFLWDDNIDIIKGVKSSRIFNHSKSHNIVNGYTFVVHDNKDNLVLLSLLISDKDTYSDILEIKENLGQLQFLLIKTHEKHIITLKSKVIMENKVNDFVFSKKENEVLYWSSVGKTYYDISIILGIKTGTVKFHMAKVVRKLGVVNAKHAIRLGIELNLIKNPNCLVS